MPWGKQCLWHDQQWSAQGRYILHPVLKMIHLEDLCFIWLSRICMNPQCSVLIGTDQITSRPFVAVNQILGKRRVRNKKNSLLNRKYPPNIRGMQKAFQLQKEHASEASSILLTSGIFIPKKISPGFSIVLSLLTLISCLGGWFLVSAESSGFDDCVLCERCGLLTQRLMARRNHTTGETAELNQRVNHARTQSAM